MSPIRVLLVEDSPVVLIILKRIFTSSPEIEIVGTARNGLEALEAIPTVQPDVICTDFHMAPMNGLEFTREVMRQFPRPILVISASVQANDTQNVFQLLQAGAVDVFPKPSSGLASDYEQLRQDLIAKIKILSGVKVFTRHNRRGMGESTPISIPSSPDSKSLPLPDSSHSPEVMPEKLSLHETQIEGRASKRAEVQKDTNFPQKPASIPNLPFPRFRWKAMAPPMAESTPPVVLGQSKPIKIVTIGASTGGPQALNSIIAQLPANWPIPVICVQHISEGFLQGLVDWLASESKLPVQIAKAGELPQPGMVYFPPERRHLELDRQGRFVYSNAPPVAGHCPSVTVTFKSVANFYGAASAAVLLTGMGRDGADGLLAIAQVGGFTIAQDESSCVVFGMPKEAIALGAAQHILPISAIAPLLLSKMGLRTEGKRI